MAIIQTNSILPLTLNFPPIPPELDDATKQYLTGLQNAILKAYTDLVKQIRVRPIVGTFAQQPAAGQAGRSFYASDTIALYVDDGTNWNLV